MRLELNHLSPPTLAIIEGYYRSERALSAFLPGSEEAAFGSRWEVVNNCAVSHLWRPGGTCTHTYCAFCGVVALVRVFPNRFAPCRTRVTRHV